jgi:hypothetical protein
MGLIDDDFLKTLPELNISKEQIVKIVDEDREDD